MPRKVGNFKDKLPALSLVFTATLAVTLVSHLTEKSGFIQVNEWFEGAKFYIYLVPVSVLDLAGSALVCLRYRQQASATGRSWLETLLSCSLMQFGGTTLTGWLLGQTPSWLLSHSAFPALLLAWWLTFYCPGDLYYAALTSVWGTLALQPAVTLVAAKSAGHAVTSWGVDKALNNAFHADVGTKKLAESAITCILSGALSASGGGILTDCLSLLQAPGSSYTWRPPSLLQASNQGDAAARPLTKSFFLASLYYLLLLPTDKRPLIAALPQFSPALARAVVALLQLQSALATMALGADPQYTALSWLARFCLLVRDGEEEGGARGKTVEAEERGRSSSGVRRRQKRDKSE